MVDDLRKIDKTIVFCIFVGPVILMFLFVIYNIVTGKSTAELIMEDDLSEHFHGKIDTQYVETFNHGIKYAELSTGYKYPIFRNWERYLEKGDSLAKDSNSFQLRIFKMKGDTLVLDYRNTYRKEVRKKLGI